MTDQAGSPGRVRSGLGSVEGFRAAMALVDAQGWDGKAGRDVLQYARSELVLPAVGARQLFGQARDDAIAAGWAAAWQACTTGPVRSAASPWGAMRVAIERAIGACYVADQHGASVRTGWRRVADGAQAPVFAPVEAAKLERAAKASTELALVPPVSECLGERLGWIHYALVTAGWIPGVAEDALMWVAANYSGSASGRRGDRCKGPAAQAGVGDNAVEDAAPVAGGPEHRPSEQHTRCAAPVTRQASGQPARLRPAVGPSGSPRRPEGAESGIRGWRHEAPSLGLPPWQLRRLAVLVGGGRTHVGLFELVVTRGRDVLSTPAATQSIASTLSRWAPCPSSVIAAYFGSSRSADSAYPPSATSGPRPANPERLGACCGRHQPTSRVAGARCAAPGRLRLPSACLTSPGAYAPRLLLGRYPAEVPNSSNEDTHAPHPE